MDSVHPHSALRGHTRQLVRRQRGSAQLDFSQPWRVQLSESGFCLDWPASLSGERPGEPISQFGGGEMLRGKRDMRGKIPRVAAATSTTEFTTNDCEDVPQRLKPSIAYTFTARLKPCPSSRLI
jgi:hypothetical protein